ncbi:TRAP transporter large permease subunit [Pusillimonas sp. TS35]|uniref:TRAP transporter large permease n=1 Tax=Paracandidimonas lactea TaxID=2895524 RepID=UPI00136DE586|nr:TRAP transporter large permease subunit [Paracandidimonas lactea]MYN13988.1 TRAP transporter large permease subunit [Pusillimonas sp. TS35]
MDNVTIGFIGLTAGLILVGLRVPIGVALGSVSFIGIAAILNMKAAWGMVTAVPFNFVGDWNLTAIPMFLLMGYVAGSTGLSKGLFEAARIFLSRLPGGLAVASVGACGLLSAASGSSVAVSAAFARIATPEMLRYRYDPGLASGVIASAGTLGSLIPPSILMILYGYVAEVSVAKIFMAGFLPGLVSALMFAFMIIIRVKLKPSLAPPVGERFTRAQKVAAIKNVWPLPVLIIGVLVGIFVGVFTPTEAGAVGAALSIVLAIVRRSLTWENLRKSVVLTLGGTAGIFMVVIGTVLLGRFMVLSGVPTFITTWFMDFGSSQLAVVLAVAALYLILGCFLDSIGLLLLTLPIVLPLARESGMDLIWFGIILVKLLELGLVTPPVGLNVYVTKSALGNLVSLTTIFKGVGWFVVTDLLTLAILVAFPWISLVLPSMMQ